MIFIMPSTSTTLYPSSTRAMKAFGQRLKDARLRRRFSAETVAARAGITRATLSKIEAGAPSVTFGNYFQVLVVLGLNQDMDAVARDDVLGRRLQDEVLPQRHRTPRGPTVQSRKSLAVASETACTEAPRVADFSHGEEGQK